MPERRWLRSVDDVVLDRDSDVRVGFLVSIAGVVFAVALFVLAVAVAVISLVWTSVGGFVISVVLFLSSLVIGVVAAFGLLRHRSRR